MGAAVIGLLGTLIGFVLGLVPLYITRKRRLKTQWYALRAEMTLCAESIEHLLNDPVAAPLYRLPWRLTYTPTQSCRRKADVSEEDVLALSAVTSAAFKTSTGGLDYASEAKMKKDDNAVLAEQSRNAG